MGAICSIMINGCELIMAWLLVLVNADFKLIDMTSSYLEHVTDMCEQFQGHMLGISMTR